MDDGDLAIGVGIKAESGNYHSEMSKIRRKPSGLVFKLIASLPTYFTTLRINPPCTHHLSVAAKLGGQPFKGQTWGVSP